MKCKLFIAALMLFLPSITLMKNFVEKQIGKSFKHSLRKTSICFSWIGFERLCDNRVGDVLFFTLLKCRLNNNILGRFYKSSQHIVYGCSS